MTTKPEPLTANSDDQARLPRRKFLSDFTRGVSGLALLQLLQRENEASADSMAHRPHRVPRAKAVIQLFMSGAASQCDTFDYKPRLIADHGKPFDPGGEVELFQSSPGPCMKSPWAWRQRGECGKWISDLVPHLGSCVDDIGFIHSMVSKSNVHGPATFMQNSGFVLPGFPAMGSWLSYGLGSLNDNLPTFVVLPDGRGFPPNGPGNWTAGFLPQVHQGTMIRPEREQPIHDLFPPKEFQASSRSEARLRRTLKRLNEDHERERPDDSRLQARIASYEMAARLQLSAPEVLGIDGESEATRRLYGIDDPATSDFGQRCLLARRLVERGVRFVQVWSGADNGFPRRNWDSHEDLARDHAMMARGMDQPAAALLKDLKARGMLDETLVMWTTEFGRMPCSQGGKGRDHNPFAFTIWMAGGGIRGGTSYGQSDEWSFRTESRPTYCYDVHATALHLLGLDHERLSIRHNGIDRRLTDVHGHVIHPILA